jgi:hypothetical protein
LQQEPCIPYVEYTRKAIKILCFYWKKIDKKYEKGPNYCDVILYMDLTVSIKVCKIEKNIYGNYQKDTINFAATDEYGILILVNMKMSYFCERILWTTLSRKTIL